MGLDFDIRDFLNHIRATKPPYECPAKGCGKIYKSFAGIQFHLLNFNHGEDSGSGGSRPGSQSPQRALTYAEAQKIVELEMDGKIQRINIQDCLTFASPEEFPISAREVPVKPEESRSQEAVVPPVKQTPKNTPKHSLKKTPKRVALEPVPPVEPPKKEEKPSPPKLPEASFIILESWNQADAPERPKSYYRFIEKTPDELEDEIEYDMDEDDFTWLDLMNKQRKFENLSEVDAQSFELLMDRLEKECYFQMQSTGKDQGPPIDEDAVCCICMDGECQNSNVILFCDMCNLAVHQECYGVPYIPEGQWLCRRCLQSPSRAVDCALCPNRGGAFKQTDDNRWAHVVCALWIPEVCFANTVFLEPIDSIHNIPAARWKLTCYICKQRGAGACIQCHRANCYTAFHVTCAQQAGLHMKIDTAKDSPSSGPNISIRKAAYCDAHTPADSDSKPLVGQDCGILGDSVKKAQSKAAFREKMRKARKILAEKRSAAPIVSIPTIPPDRVQEIAASVPQIQGKIRFIQRLIAYWTLKRQSRNGVPLLRRLQTSHPSSSSRRPPTASSSIGGHGGGSGSAEPSSTQPDDLLAQLRYFQRLRQDLERARLLCELIRKREKTKRELMRIREKELELQIYPFRSLMRTCLAVLREKDTQEIFAEPVDITQVPDYLEYIQTPMDLSTMSSKLEAGAYATVDAFEKDFQLMIHNCMVYNTSQTTYYKQAVRLKESARSLFRQLRKDLTEPYGTGEDDGGEEEVPEKDESEAEEDLPDLEDYLVSKERSTESLEQQLSKLEDYLKRTKRLPTGQLRVKRLRAIKAELAKVRRNLLLASGGRAAGMRSSSSSSPSKTAARPSKKDTSETDTGSESSSSSSSSSSSNPSDYEKKKKKKPNFSTVKASPRATLAARQLKIDSFITRTSKTGAGSSQTTDSDEKSNSGTTPGPSSKNRMLAKVMKRNNSGSTTNSAGGSVPTPGTPVSSTVPAEPVETISPPQLLLSSVALTPVTPVKSGTTPSSSSSLTGSPSGVNRRTAVLFTKKAAAAAFKKPDMSGSSSPPRRTPGRPRKTSDSSSGGSGPSGGATAPLASVSTNLFVAAAAAVAASSIPASTLSLPEPVPQPSSSKRSSKKQANRPSTGPFLSHRSSAGGELLPPNIESEAFKVYRTRMEDEEESHRGSGSSGSDSSSGSSSGSSGSSGSDSESEGDGSDDSASRNRRQKRPDRLSVRPSSATASSSLNPLPPCSLIPLQPLDLVWAKCRGYPWYPALIVDPAWPRSGYVHNGVPIAIPPEDVLLMGSSLHPPCFLVLFFDAKRTWQWLPRDKLEPLGVDPDRDKAKMNESKKQTDRKAVKKAFEDAVFHQCRVTGQSSALMEDSDSSSSSSSQSP